MDDSPAPDALAPPWVAMLQAHADRAEHDPRRHQEEKP